MELTNKMDALRRRNDELFELWSSLSEELEEE
jgi:hypothetical protein